MKKILVVDDERPISDIIKFNLTKEGYEVVTAFDGREALEQFEAKKPDLVILDLMLPELDGLEVAKEIRKTSHTPIIMPVSYTHLDVYKRQLLSNTRALSAG